MTRTSAPTVVSRRGPDMDKPWEVGDRYEVYEAIEPFPTIVFDDALIGDDPGESWDAHAAGEQWAPQVNADRKAKKGRELRRISCRCAAGPSLAYEYIDGRGVRWAVIRPEKIPASFRLTTEHENAEKAYPMHVHPNGSPHVELATCRRCNQVWMIAFDSETLEGVPVRVTLGGVVAP